MIIIMNEIMTRGYELNNRPGRSGKYPAGNGCKERKCPCRMWVNCHAYINVQRQALRLERKKYSVNRWYRHNFRSEIHMQDIIANG